jgi:predicted RNA-binding protein with PIN domain
VSAQPDDQRVALPDRVRAEVLGLAADTLGGLDDAEVPSGLRAVRRFTPGKRARLGAIPLAAALERDPAFRAAVAGRVRAAFPGLAEQLAEGVVPAAAPPDRVAAAAFLLRAPGWAELVAAAAGEQAQADAAAAVAAREAAAARHAQQLQAARDAAHAQVESLRRERDAALEQADAARRQLRSSADRGRKAELEAQRGLVAAEADRDQALERAAREQAELHRLRDRVAELETALETVRRGAREARASDDARLRVLLDTLAAAAAGVRRELALPPVIERPADTVAGGLGEAARIDPLAGIGGRGLAPDDPSIIDQLLTVPGLHLLVDGYNVTKGGYASLTLEDQRVRLLRGLGGLASRAAVELTCVFDGTAAVTRPAAVTVPRGVRVLFSPVGEIADEVIVRLVREEPPGRPVAVVTSDRAVAERVRRAGARAVPSSALLARLERA